MSDMGTAGGAKRHELLKATLGDDQYYQLMSDLGTAGGTKRQELLKAALGDDEYYQLMSDLGTAGGTKRHELLKAALGEEEYSQLMSDMGTAGGTKKQELLKASLGDEGYSQLKSDAGKKGGLGNAEAHMKKNLRDGKSIHVIHCIAESGQEGCAGETWLIGCRNGSGYIQNRCRKCRQNGDGRHSAWKEIGRALDEEEVSEAFQLKKDDKSLAYVTKALKLD
eukprot:scaffold442_cov109-Skeletonema_dohrnii-CCMP3373.AAC.3